MNNVIGKYVRLDNTLYKIVESNIGEENQVSLYNIATQCYARHYDGLITEDMFEDSDTFKHDSSFYFVLRNNNVAFKCSNPGFDEIYLAKVLNGVSLQHISSPHNDIYFLLIDSHDVLTESLYRISTLESKLDKLLHLFELHHPITEIPKSFGKLREFQEGGIKIFNFFIQVCKKYNLSYWIDYGTLLGAVRHKGYIPWDDDLDICMPADDFQKFQQVISKELIGTDICYKTFHPFIYKLEEISGNEEERAFLDIFPFYPLRCDISIDSYESAFRQAREKRAEIIKYASDDEIRDFALSFNAKYRAEDNSHVFFRGFEAADHPLFDVIKYDDIFPLIELEFEGMSVFAPRNYKEKLEAQYGNYWEYPPAFISHRSF